MNSLHYLDTSFVAAYLLPEPESDLVEATLRSLPAGSFRVSHWTGTEMASLLARKVRMEKLSPHDSLKVLGAYNGLISDGVIISVDVTANDFQIAAQWVMNAQLALRGPDGLHLAVAHRLDATIWTLDGQMKLIAEELGLKTG